MKKIKIISFILIFFAAIDLSCMNPETTIDLARENAGSNQAIIEIGQLLSTLNDNEEEPRELAFVSIPASSAPQKSMDELLAEISVIDEPVREIDANTNFDSSIYSNANSDSIMDSAPIHDPFALGLPQIPHNDNFLSATSLANSSYQQSDSSLIPLPIPALAIPMGNNDFLGSSASASASPYYQGHNSTLLSTGFGQVMQQSEQILDNALYMSQPNLFQQAHSPTLPASVQIRSSSSAHAIAPAYAALEPAAGFSRKSKKGNDSDSCDDSDSDNDSEEDTTITTQKVLKKHKCPNCSYTHRYASVIKSHMKTHQIRCAIPTCKVNLGQKKGLSKEEIEKIKNDHIKKHAPAFGQFKCQPCTLYFTTSQELKSHQTEYHTKQTPQSHHTISQGAGAGASEDHPFKCANENCTKSYPTRTGLKNHIKETHTIYEIECNLNNGKCKETFIKRSGVGSHKKIHSAYNKASQSMKDSNRACHECELLYSRKEQCTQHKKKYHPASHSEEAEDSRASTSTISLPTMPEPPSEKPYEIITTDRPIFSLNPDSSGVGACAGSSNINQDPISKMNTEIAIPTMPIDPQSPILVLTPILEASSAQAADSSLTVDAESGNVRFKCTQENCSKNYKTKESLTRHIEIAHQGRRFNCTDGNGKCKETFKRINSLSEHKKFHSAYNEAPQGTQDPTLVCHECELLYRNKHGYSQHKNKYHCESSLIAIASKTVSEENRETNTESAELDAYRYYEYRCSKCGQNFETKNGLTYHTKSYHPVIPFPCTVSGCTMKFANNEHKISHEDCHNNPGKYLYCRTCGRAFSTDNTSSRSSYVKHMNTHKSYGPVVIPIPSQALLVASTTKKRVRNDSKATNRPAKKTKHDADHSSSAGACSSGAGAGAAENQIQVTAPLLVPMPNLSFLLASSAARVGAGASAPLQPTMPLVNQILAPQAQAVLAASTALALARVPNYGENS